MDKNQMRNALSNAGILREVYAMIGEAATKGYRDGYHDGMDEGFEAGKEFASEEPVECVPIIEIRVMIAGGE